MGTKSVFESHILTDIYPEQGRCWIAPLPSHVPPGDDLDVQGRSTLVLAEDDVELPFGHCPHQEIRLAGSGRYSHWGRAVYFSTSDDSDPRRNGRVYRLCLPHLAHKSAARPATLSADQTIRVLFIIGCGRSGTTLLADLFKGHPEVRSTQGHPDGEDNQGWIVHGGAAISGGTGDPSLDQGKAGLPYCLHMDQEDVTPQIRDSMRRYYLNDVLDGDPSRLAVNKNVHICNKINYVRAIFPEARFVHIIRDAVPTVASWAKQMDKLPELSLYLPDVDYPCLWLLPTSQHAHHHHAFARSGRFYPGSIDCLAEYWHVINRNIPRQMKDAQDRLLTVRYEDLCADPQQILARVSDFVGLSAPPVVPEWLDISLRPVHAGALSDSERARVLKCTAATRRQFGYT